MGSFDDLPGRGRNHEIDERAQTAFATLLANSERLFLQQPDRRDYGSDVQIEVIDNGHPTNVRIHVQLKGSERTLNPDGSLTIQVQRTTFNYLMAQNHSVFVAYHLPTDSLRVSSLESVLRHYEHADRGWMDQQTLSISFLEPLTLERLETLAGLAGSSARTARDSRIAQVTASAAELPSLLREAAPLVHVPDDPVLARERLQLLYEHGADAAISGAYEQFAAILGDDDQAMGCCYMAEINLGMARRSRFPERIEAAIAHFESKLAAGGYQPGSLHYTIGNARSALGDELAAKSSYQAAASDMMFMADPAMAAQCLKNLGSSFERLGEDDTAAELYRGALDMDPHLPEARLALAQHLHRKGELEGALLHYDEAILTERQLGTAATVTGWRLNILFSLGQIREAYRAVNQLLSEASREPWIWPWCARQVAAFGRSSVEAAHGALEFWRRYVRAHPEDSRARLNLLLTQFYLRQEGDDLGKDYAAFRAEFDMHIAHVTLADSALAWDRLGHWAQDEANWVEAERCYRRAYDIDGGHYGYCLGTALNFMGRHDEALPLLLAQAEAIQPDAMSWCQLAVAHERLGHPVEAVAAYRKALDLDPDYALAMFNMAGTLWNSGDHNGAEIIFREAARKFPGHELTAKLRQDFPEFF